MPQTDLGSAKVPRRRWTIALLLGRFGVRRVGIISTMIWSVASFAAAISTGMGGLFGARFLLGIGEAPTFPANAKAIGYWFPKNEHSLRIAQEPPRELRSLTCSGSVKCGAWPWVSRHTTILSICS